MFCQVSVLNYIKRFDTILFPYAGTWSFAAHAQACHNFISNPSLSEYFKIGPSLQKVTILRLWQIFTFFTSAWLRMSVLLSTLAPVVVSSFLIFFATVAKPLTIIGHRCSNSDWYFVTDFGRGHPALLPEHSETGYISAIKHGADFIECDVHFTRWHELLTL